MAARRQKKLTDDDRVLWRDAVDNIRFLKQQQWRVTNYAGLIYVAVLYLFSRDWFWTCGERAVLAVLVGGVALINVGLLWILQNNMNKFRARIGKMYEYASFAASKEELRLGEHRPWLDRLIAIVLTAFTLVAAGFVGFVVLFRDPPSL